MNMQYTHPVGNDSVATKLAPPDPSQRRLQRPLRILIVLKTLRWDGGVEGVAASLTKGLREQGHEVFVAALSDHFDDRWHDTVGLDRERYLGLGDCDSVRKYLASILKLRSFLTQKRIDIVHTHLFLPGLLGRLAAALHPARTVSTEHSTFFHWWTPWHYAVDRWLARRTNALTAVSRSAAATLASRCGITPDQIHVIPNMVDTEAFQPDPRQPRDPNTILVAGRMEYPKNHLYALRVLSELIKSDPEKRMVFLGRGSLSPQIEDAVSGMGLSASVDLKPPTHDIATELRKAGLLLMTSRWEGMPLVVLEAQATKTPVVATAVPGIIDVVRDGQTGRLIAPDCAVSAARVINDLQIDHDRRRTLAETAYGELSTYERATVVGRYIQLYQSLVLND